MLSEEDKEKIVEKVRFEKSIREKLNSEDKPKRFFWLNSKLFLLLVGALMTGILVPRFQQVQKELEWKRQNQFENINFRLGKMRDCLTGFVHLSTYMSEAYEIVKPLMDKDSITDDEHLKFEQKYLDLQNRRFQKNAQVRSLVIYFIERNTVERLVKDYVNYSSYYMRELKRFIEIQSCLSGEKPCEQGNTSKQIRNKLKSGLEMNMMQSMDVRHTRCIGKIMEEIERVEDESKEFRR